jgi:hypothetical protein
MPGGLLPQEMRMPGRFSHAAKQMQRAKRRARVGRMPRAFCINAKDNVATLLDDVREPQAVQVLGASSVREVCSSEPIALGHKIALRDVREGEPIVKFGVPIGHASQAIRAGEWIHLHNCESAFDERSRTLDLHTGAATDTKYE